MVVLEQAERTDTVRRVMAALPFAQPLYARVDLIRADDGAPRLLELELTEPSLFFAQAAGAARRLADELCGVLRSSSG